MFRFFRLNQIATPAVNSIRLHSKLFLFQFVQTQAITFKKIALQA